MNPRDREYEFLKKEIEQRVSIIYTNIKILYVTLTAILAWAITKDMPLICILGYCIIIPSYNIVMDYYIGILRIGAYINVFIPEYPWEIRLHKVNTLYKDNSADKKKIIKRYDSAYKVPYFFSNLMCFGLTLFLTDFNSLETKNIVILIACLAIFICFTVHIKNQRSNDDIKQQYIDEFEKIKNAECSSHSNQSSPNESPIPLEQSAEQNDCTITTNT